MVYDITGISLTTGKRGSGKTYLIIQMILEQLEHRTIFTNVKLSIDHPNYIYKNEGELKKFIAQINYYFDDVNDMPTLIESLRTKDFFGAFFILDEAHFLGFRKISDGLVNWLSVSRHVGQDIMLITQTTKKINNIYIPDIGFHYDLVAYNKRIHKDLIGYNLYDEVGGDKVHKPKYLRPNPDIFEIYKTGKSDSSTNPQVLKAVGLIFALIAVLVFFYYFFVRGVLPNVSSPVSVVELNATSNNTDIEITIPKKIDTDTNETIPFQKRKKCSLETKIVSTLDQAKSIKGWKFVQYLPVKSYSREKQYLIEVHYKVCQIPP